MAIIFREWSYSDFIEWRLFMVIIFFQVGIILRALAIIRERQILEIFELQLISGICNYPSGIYDFLTLENLIFLEFQLSSWILQLYSSGLQLSFGSLQLSGIQKTYFYGFPIIFLDFAIILLWIAIIFRDLQLSGLEEASFYGIPIIFSYFTIIFS